MKNKSIKLFPVIAFAAAIGLSITSCGEEPSISALVIINDTAARIECYIVIDGTKLVNASTGLPKCTLEPGKKAGYIGSGPGFNFEIQKTDETAYWEGSVSEGETRELKFSELE